MNSRNLIPMLLAASAAVAIAVAPVAIAGAQNDGPNIDSVVRAVDATYHLHHQTMPMMRLVSGLARSFTTGGVRDMHIVTYDEIPAAVDTTSLTSLVRDTLNTSWSLTARSQSIDADDTDEITGTHRHIRNDDMVWMQPHGKRMRVLTVALDSHTLSLVQMDLTPEALNRWESDHHSEHTDME